ncbi:MAG: MFS transporter [Chloroflexi bacterium]|nr:MFS transporter [Chloroflexota bacterium]
MEVVAVAPWQRWGQSFSLLRHREFRLLWVATTLISSSSWMEALLLGWLVLERTNSPLLVGAVAAMRSAWWLMGPLGGLLADRLDRRRLLVLTHGINVAQATAMLSLLLMDRLAVWHIFVLASASGLTHASDYPTRHALVAELVGHSALANAIALIRVAMDITVIMGPFLAGSLAALFSPAGGYALVLLFYVATIVVLLMVRPTHQAAPAESAWRNVMEGIGHLRRNQSARLILFLCLVANVLGFPVLYALLPVFARNVLGVGPAGLGLLMSSAGLGSLAGSLGLALIGRRPSLMMAGFLLWPAFLLPFAASGWYALSLALLMLAWAGQSLAMNMSTTLLILTASPEMRGRIMGVRALVIAGSPLGSLALGALAGRMGAPLTLTIGATAFVAIVAALGLARPRLWLSRRER